MPIGLVPETVVEKGRYWTIATNLKQNLPHAGQPILATTGR